MSEDHRLAIARPVECTTGAESCALPQGPADADSEVATWRSKAQACVRSWWSSNAWREGVRMRSKHMARWAFIAAVSALALGTGATFRTTRATAACPDEVLRAENGSLGLPDCRVYEKVTPASKNGAEFNGGVFSSAGPRLAFESFATFGGAEFSGAIGTSYETIRSENGWSTHPLGGPAPQFEGTNLTTPLRALGSNGTSLLGLRPRGVPIDGENLYIREGNSLTEIGPEAPPSTLVGVPDQEAIGYDQNSGYFNFQVSTPDLSHVIFELFSPGEHNYLWPFDKTGEGFLSSTYEYAGTGNSQPFLVGVSGGPGSTELVSGCGTSVGSFGSQDTYNAISSDGSVVFFTAWGEDMVGPCSTSAPEPAHTELYARIDGEKANAHTVAVSDPSPEDCAACETASPSLATFQGASEDGSKVFFLTAGELLPGNPGTNLYEYNFDGPSGAKVTAVSHLNSNAEAGVQGVVRVAADGSRVYFVATAALTGEPNSTGAVAEAGKDNLYVYNTGSKQVKFVATLTAEDSGLWSALDLDRQAQATPNGQFLLFTSVGQLTSGDTSTVKQLFRYDAVTGELTRISVGQNGYNNNGNTETSPVILGPGAIFERYAVSQNGPSPRLISNDGSFVFFESTNGLTPKALNHVELPNHVGLFAENIYEWHNGEISLISDGRDRKYIGVQNEFEQISAVHLIGATEDAQDVLFTTADPLVPGDMDEAQDIYDARMGGGFLQASGGGCEGEGCQGPSSPAPAVGLAGSSAFSGPGNPAPVKPHKKKKTKKPRKKKHTKKGHKKHTKRGHKQEHRKDRSRSRKRAS